MGTRDRHHEFGNHRRATDACVEMGTDAQDRAAGTTSADGGTGQLMSGPLPLAVRQAVREGLTLSCRRDFPAKEGTAASWLS